MRATARVGSLIKQSRLLSGEFAPLHTLFISCAVATLDAFVEAARSHDSTQPSPVRLYPHVRSCVICCGL
jgi:hypothetical protein